MTSTATLAEACAAAARFWSNEQSGPKPGSREALYLAGLLREAGARLSNVAHEPHLPASGEGAP